MDQRAAPETADRDVEHVAVLIHGTSQIILLPADADENLVQVPFLEQLVEDPRFPGKFQTIVVGSEIHSVTL